MASSFCLVDYILEAGDRTTAAAFPVIPTKLTEQPADDETQKAFLSGDTRSP
jgi:hypothetical protein